MKCNLQMTFRAARERWGSAEQDGSPQDTQAPSK